jgi:hypothetical protein
MPALKLDDKMVLASTAFAAGLAVGLLARGGAKQMYDSLRNRPWGRGDTGTVTYDNNLPAQLKRREPAGEEPRFGGTGALGVSPAVVAAANPRQS